MKKTIAIILTLCMLFFTSAAFAAMPGDTVTVPIMVNNTDACFFQLRISFDTSVFEAVSLTASEGYATGTSEITVSAADVLPSGQYGTLTLKIKDNAAAGTYRISVTIAEAWNGDDDYATVTASAGSVTVESTACTSHVWDNGTVTTQPTCAKEGVRTYACTNSGCDETKTESIPKLTTHTWDNGTVTTEPTCTKEGVKTYTCSVCKGTKTEAIPAAGHDDGEWVTVTPATCKKDGLKELQCTVCDEVLDSEVIPAAGIDHTEGEWATTTEPTCTKPGEKSLTCSVCGDVLDTEAIPATGHTEGEWATTTEPTCTEDGEKALTCSVCGDVLDTEAIPATGHDDGEWVVVTPATCKADGTKELQCTFCG